MPLCRSSDAVGLPSELGLVLKQIPKFWSAWKTVIELLEIVF